MESVIKVEMPKTHAAMMLVKKDYNTILASATKPTAEFVKTVRPSIDT